MGRLWTRLGVLALAAALSPVAMAVPVLANPLVVQSSDGQPLPPGFRTLNNQLTSGVGVVAEGRIGGITTFEIGIGNASNNFSDTDNLPIGNGTVVQWTLTFNPGGSSASFAGTVGTQTQTVSFTPNPAGLTTEGFNALQIRSFTQQAGFNLVLSDFELITTLDTFDLADWDPFNNINVTNPSGPQGRTLNIANVGDLMRGFTFSGEAVFSFAGSTAPTQSRIAFQISSANYTAPIPEPATWAMMLIGFGLVALRVRGRGVVPA